MLVAQNKFCVPLGGLCWKSASDLPKKYAHSVKPSCTSSQPAVSLLYDESTSLVDWSAWPKLESSRKRIRLYFFTRVGNLDSTTLASSATRHLFRFGQPTGEQSVWQRYLNHKSWCRVQKRTRKKKGNLRVTLIETWNTCHQKQRQTVMWGREHEK